MWKLLSAILCSYAACAFVTAESQGGCSIKIPTDIQGFAPVILTSSSQNDYQLFRPTGEVTTLEEGTQLLLVCTGNNNNIESTDSDSLNLDCSNGDFVDSNNNVYQLNELVCNSIPSSTLKVTTDPCSNDNGVIYQTGFTISDQFYGPVFEICYNNDDENTFYSHVTLNGAAMNFAITERTRRSFKADGMKFSTSKTNSFYIRSNQFEVFERIFGPDQTYMDNRNFLARGHLTAHADLILGYERLATYYYVNAAPQFQPINAGNWLRVEDIARSVSATYGDDIESYTGYMGILKLPKDNGDLVEIYLDDTKKIEIPKYFYKVLVHKASDSAIVFVTVNNPHITDGPAEEFCTNVCEQSGLINENFSDVTKGYTFCCNLDEFKLSVNDALPDEVQGSNLLKSSL